MMKVEYELAPEDWAAYGEYYARSSPGFRRNVRVNTAAGVLIQIVIAGLVSLLTHSPGYLVAGLAVAILYAFYWPRHVIANVRSHMARAERPCLRGRHFMEALPEGLQAKCDVTDSTIQWTGIQRVIRTPDHFFVVLSEVQAYVIPQKRLIAGELEPLIDEIELRIARNRSTAPSISA